MFVKIYFVLLSGLFLYVQSIPKGISVYTMTTSKPIDQQYLEDCLKESGATLIQVNKLKAGSYSKSSPELKKWAFCYLVKTGVMSYTGVLRQHVVLKDIPEKEKTVIENTINECLYKKAHDPVDTAWHYLTCFQSKQPKYAKNANHI